MSIADVSGDGLIDYNEFVAATMHLSKLEKEELLQKVGRGLGGRRVGWMRGCGVWVGRRGHRCDAVPVHGTPWKT
jgi:hypothetical protein